MKNHKFELSPMAYARTAGLLYLIIIVAGLFAEMFVREPMIVNNNAAATAHNIMSHESLFRMGFAAELVAGLCNIPLILIFYELFKIVNKRVILLVVFFSLVGTAIESVVLIDHFAPLIILKQAGANLELFQSQAYIALKLQSIGFSIALTFFAGYCVSMGYLIFRSGFMPRFIGVLLSIEGVCYFANSM